MLENEFELIVEYSEEKNVTIEDIVKAVFGMNVEDMAEYFLCPRNKDEDTKNI